MEQKRCQTAITEAQSPVTLNVMPVISLRRRSSSSRKMRRPQSEASMDYLRATGKFGSNVRPLDLVTFGYPSNGSLDGNIPSRNVKTAPSTPEAEFHSFVRHGGSTSQLEISTPTHISKKQGKGSDGESGPKSPNKEVSPKLKKSRNDKFHKLFRDMPIDEHVLNAYSCAYIGDILLQGYLYISKNWFCFYSKILGHEKLIEIPVSKVVNISREKTAFFIPNAIGIRTSEDKYVFGSLMSRDNTYKLMWSVLKDIRAKEGIPTKETDDVDVVDINQLDVDGGGSGAENENTLSTVSSKAHLRLTPNSSCASEESEDISVSEQLLVASSAAHTTTSLPSLPNSSPKHRDRSRRPSSMKNQHRKTHYVLHYVDYRKIWSLIQQLVKWLWSLPRTSLLLLICSIVAVMLVISAVMLSYKLLVLQAAIENSSHETPMPVLNSDNVYQSLYYLSNQNQAATIERFHSIIRANIQLLGQVHESLKTLRVSPLGDSCSTKSENETPAT